MQSKVNQIKKELIDVLKVDLTEGLAQDFVNGLFGRINADKANSLEEIAESGAEVFETLAQEVYGPLMVAYVDWVLQLYKKIECKGNILFASRDAIPLYHIASILADKHSIDKNKIKELYYTRKIAGQSDEIAGFGVKTINTELLKQYLKQEGVSADSMIVDMGLYGSLYKLGCEKKFWGGKPNLVFLYSKNPNIVGFLNPELENNRQLGNLIADCGECVNPQKVWSPSELVEINGKVMPKLEPINNYLIQIWADMAIAGYKKAAREFIADKKIDVCYELQKIQNLSDQAKKGEFTGVLPYCTLEWSQKDKFLELWGLGYIPPKPYVMKYGIQ
jgi:hypothetical protein